MGFSSLKRRQRIAAPQPADILNEIAALDTEAAAVLGNIGNLLERTSHD